MKPISPWRAGAIVCIGLALAGCAQRYVAVTPELDARLMTATVSGQAVLDCQIACSFSWGSNLANLAQRDATGDWHGLALAVLQLGYENDLAYYYLGRAAEGLGAPEAALRYYQISGAAATGANPVLRCANGSVNQCNGVSLPHDLYPRIQAIEADLAARKAAQNRPPLQVNAPARHKPSAAPSHNGATPPPAPDAWIDPPPVVR